MSLQHTPGPWILDPEEKREHIDETYHFINAGIGFYDPDTGTGFSMSGYLSKADATLISAAPDLLDALTTLVEATDEMDNASLFDAVRKAEVAIAKATEGGIDEN